MKRKPTVLFSGRDPGGVGHILALLQGFRDDGRFEVEVVASGVALAMLEQSGEHPRSFTMSSGLDYLESGQDTAPLIAAAKGLLDQMRANAVIASLSSFGVGIDEALVASCEAPSFVMQDFWGDVNMGLGVPADTYFVIDEYAAQLSRSRWGVKAISVGSPKHSRYQFIDVDLLRRESRRSLGVSDGQPVIGFFGQSSRIPGHEAAFKDLARAIAKMECQPLFLLREHGKFANDRHAHLDFANAIGLTTVDVTGKSTAETWLAACDVVVTCFSSCAYDHAYLSAYSSEPIGTTLYLLCNPDIQASAVELCGFLEPPNVTQGLGKVARDPASIGPLLEQGLTTLERDRYHTASKRLPKGNSPLRAITNTVAQTLGVPSHSRECLSSASHGA